MPARPHQQLAPGLARGPFVLLGAALALIDGYLTGLLVAAAMPAARRGGHPERGSPTHFLVLIPAHDESAGIARCIAALKAAAHEPACVDICVIADNCSDDTAAAARAQGVRVLERVDPERRGKGYALNWALAGLPGMAGFTVIDAIALVDADCEVSQNFFSEVDEQFQRGAQAVQAAYVVANPAASRSTGVRAVAFLLMATVRPRGRERLGLSAGLFGTGMAFERDLLVGAEFDASSLVEDADLHLRLVLAGHRVAFADAAHVASPMPTRSDVSRAQQSRWEGGRTILIRRFTLPLLREGLRRRDRVRVAAPIDLFVPPQSILSLLHLLLIPLSLLSGAPTRRSAAILIVMHAGFVLGGLRLARAPRSLYASLASSPWLVVDKLRVLTGIARSGAPESWERTARD